MEYVNDKSKEELVVEEKFFDETNALPFSQRGSKLKNIENRIYNYLFRLAFNFGMVNDEHFYMKKKQKRRNCSRAFSKRFRYLLTYLDQLSILGYTRQR